MITGKCERFYMVNMDRFCWPVRDINHLSTLMSLFCLKAYVVYELDQNDIQYCF